MNKNKIENLKRRLKRYTTGKILGFPGSTPLPQVVEWYNEFNKLNPNAIMLHYKHLSHTKKHLERGVFGIINEMEKKILASVSALLRGDKEDVWGYITTGGTESNIFALWVARNKFLKVFNAREGGIQIIVPAIGVTHYSIFKALNLLGLTYTNAEGIEETYLSSPHKLIYVPVNHNGELDYDSIRNKIENKPTIVIVNAPSINTGLIDKYSKLLSLFDEKGIEKEKIWVHIDGAFGMWIIPFIEDEIYNNIGGILEKNYQNFHQKDIDSLYFDNKFVKSITIDLHKMALVPYPSSIVLIKEKEGWKYIRRKAGYLADEYDETLGGSRSGASVAASYAAVFEVGIEKYKEIIRDCLEMTNEFIEKINNLGVLKIIGSPFLNIFSVTLNEEDNKIRKKWEKITHKWTIVKFSLPTSENKEYWRFVIMPHVTMQSLEEFIVDLSNLL